MLSTQKLHVTSGYHIGQCRSRHWVVRNLKFLSSIIRLLKPWQVMSWKRRDQTFSCKDSKWPKSIELIHQHSQVFQDTPLPSLFFSLSSWNSCCSGIGLLDWTSNFLSFPSKFPTAFLLILEICLCFHQIFLSNLLYLLL